MAPQLIARKRSSRRGLARWSAFATSSLPVPLSPTISTFERVGATSFICSNSALHRRRAADDALEAEALVEQLAELDDLVLELALLELVVTRLRSS